jgi:hypothetical protein
MSQFWKPSLGRLIVFRAAGLIPAHPIAPTGVDITFYISAATGINVDNLAGLPIPLGSGYGQVDGVSFAVFPALIVQINQVEPQRHARPKILGTHI